MKIYKITNSVTGKVYIGKTTVKLKRRFYLHSIGRGGSSKLYGSIKKHGIDAFNIEIIDNASSPDELSSKEEYWIAQYNSVNDGYNRSPFSSPCGTIANNARWAVASIEDRLKVGEAMKSGWENKDRSSVVKENWAALTPEEKAAKSTGISTSWMKLTPEERSERAKKGSLAALEKSRAFRYLCTSPDGTEYDIKGLGVFCSQHNLDKKEFRKISEGKLKDYNGWKCYRINDEGNVVIPEPFVRKKSGPKAKK